MRIQLKVPGAVSSGLPTIRAAATRAIPRPPRPPDGPGCSRWLSCTCCRSGEQQSKVDTTFFTRQSLPLPRQAGGVASDLRQEGGRGSLLPLPPTLPYSPDSVPFQRHMQHLSLAVVSSSPEESWRTYLALHPSLRRYIPDDLFRSLLAHQLSIEHAKQSWTRALALIKFAKRCGVDARQLGQENLFNALRTGLDLVTRTKVSDLRLHWGDVMALWAQLVDHVDSKRKLKARLRIEEDNMPIDLRKAYLRMHIKRRTKPKESRQEAVSLAHAALREVVERFGPGGIEREAGKIVSLYDGPDESIHLDALALAAWCVDRQLAIPTDVVSVVMLRLCKILEAGSRTASTLDQLGQRIEDHVMDRSEGVGMGTDLIGQTLAQLRHRNRPLAQKTLESAEAIEDTPQLVRRTVKLLDETESDLDVALNALDVLLQRDGEVDVVVARLLGKLAGSRHPDILVRLTRLLLERDALRHLRLDHIQLLLHSLIRCLPNNEVYDVCRKVYAIARQHGYHWHRAHRRRWSTLFNQAIDRNRRHLHFASRLYADLRADGHEPRQRDLIAFVRTIGMSRSASRAVLLERIIGDVIGDHSNASPSILDSLVVALVQGLIDSHDPSDASFALHLAQRILQDQPIPNSAAELLLQSLARSSNMTHLRQAVQLLVYTPQLTTHSINTVIFAVIANSRSDPQLGQMSRREALSQAVGLYKRMVEQGIEANPRTVSLLLRALIDARYVDSAINVFDASVRHDFVLKPNAVGRLMVRLIVDDRLDEAANVEQRWRGLSAVTASTGRRYDRAIVGARVLLDTKRGIEVDLVDIAKRTGWTSSLPFSRFIDSLKPRSVADGDSDAQQVKAYEGAEVENPGCTRPAAITTDRVRRPWIRSDNNHEDISADSIVATRNGSIVT